MFRCLQVCLGVSALGPCSSYLVLPFSCCVTRAVSRLSGLGAPDSIFACPFSFLFLLFCARCTAHNLTSLRRKDKKGKELAVAMGCGNRLRVVVKATAATPRHASSTTRTLTRSSTYSHTSPSPWILDCCGPLRLSLAASCTTSTTTTMTTAAEGGWAQRATQGWRVGVAVGVGVVNGVVCGGQDGSFLSVVWVASLPPRGPPHLRTTKRHTRAWPAGLSLPLRSACFVNGALPVSTLSKCGQQSCSCCFHQPQESMDSCPPPSPSEYRASRGLVARGTLALPPSH